jgi:hypothetical protein
MPGLVPIVGDVVQARVVCTTSTQVGMNITHWRVVSVIGVGASLQQIADQLDALLFTPYKAWLSAAASYRGVGVTNIMGDRSVEQVSVAHSGVGAAAVSLIPTQVSGLIKWKTQSAGRHFRGRIYIPFPASNNQDVNGELNIGGVARLADILTGYFPSLVVTIGAAQSTLQLVILHQPTPSRPIPPASLTTDVSLGAVVPEWATQRRRGDFGRPNVAPF